jgi:uncharacterized protein YegL
MKYIILSLVILTISSRLFAQTLDIFDIDASGFPIMKAKFLAFDAKGEQLINLNPSDFSINEEGNIRKIISVKCQTKIMMLPVSTVLVMDASGSMRGRNLELAKSAARSWINAMPADGQSECAISAFDNINYLIQDFTGLKPLLISKVDNLFALNGTNYNAAFVDQLYGGLLISRNAKFKKIIVIMTDGRPTNVTDETQIIAEALKQEAVIFAVTLGMPCPPVLRNITTATGGKFFENVSSKPEVESTYQQILQMVQGVEACEIVWESDVSCSGGERIADIDFYPQNTNRLITYTMPPGTISGVALSHESIFFKNVVPGTSRDSIISIFANSGNLNVSDIKFSNPAFDVAPKSFKINKGQSQQLRITYTAPIGGAYTWARMEILNNLCPVQFFVSGGAGGKKPDKKTLKLIQPNGGEEFVAGTDTEIKWEGIPETDTVKLEYSINNGNSWIDVAPKTTSGTFNWKRIPRTPSTECLMKVTQLSMDNVVNPEWVNNFGGDFYTTYQEKHSGITFDIYGKIYVVSIFKDKINFQGKEYTSKGEEDIIVGKLEPNGEIIWITQLGGTDSDIPTGIVVDSYGNSFITGKFSKLLEFDKRGLTSHGNTDIFIAKLLPDGTVEWAKNPGGTGDDYSNDIGIDNLGNIFITGGYSKICKFDKDSLVSAGQMDAFVAKYAPEGKLIWVKSIGGEFHDEGTSITIDLSGKILSTGKFTKNAKFGSHSLIGVNNNTELTDFDVYVLKYFSNGTVEWVKQAGGLGDDEPFGIATDSRNDIFITGRFFKKANFGNIEITPKTIGVSNITSDIFVSKILSNGTYDWVNRAGGNSDDSGFDIAVDTDNNVVVTGSIISIADFSGKSIESKGFVDVFAAKYSNDGNIFWAKRAGGDFEDYGRSVAVDGLGNSFITGIFTKAGSFGTNNISTEMGLMDVFVWGVGGGEAGLQSDESDSLWTIVAPKANAIDIDMGQAFIGTSKDSTISNFLNNVGAYKIEVDSLYFSGLDKTAFDFVSGTGKFVVEINSSADLEVRFNPVKVGINRAEIVIYTQSDTIKANIKGEGLLPDLQVVNRAIDFGKVLVGNFKDTVQVVTIVNNSKKSLKITKTKHNKPNDIDFTTVSGGGKFTLNSGDTAKLDLRFTPSEKGRTNGLLEFHYEGSGSPAIIQLGGEGVNPNPSILVSNNIFNDIFCESDTKSDIQFSNKGGAELEIKSITFTGNNGTNFSIIENFPIKISPDKTKNITVNFNDNNPGFKTASMVVKSNSYPDAVTSIPLTLMLNGAGVESDKSIVDFGILDISQSGKDKIKITNIGNYGSLFELNNLTSFTTDKKSVYLLPKQSIDINVDFIGSANAGIFTENLIIKDTLCKFETIITLNAVVSKKEKPVIAVGNHSIGEMICYNQQDDEILITNRGLDELIISSISMTGNNKEDFEFDLPSKMKLAKDEVTKVILRFKPKTPGLKQAFLEISSNSEVNPEYKLEITGSYETTDFSVLEPVIDLNKINTGKSADFKFRITNLGSVTNKYILKESNLLTLEINEILLNSGQYADISGQLKPNSNVGNISAKISVTDTICNIAKDIEIKAIITAGANLTLKMGVSQGYAGDRVEIPVTIANSSNLEQYDIKTLNFELSFNASILAPDFPAEYNITNGIGKLTVKDIQFKINNELQTTLPFIVGLGNVLETELEISNLKTNISDIGVIAQNGKFTSLGICFEGGARLINSGQTGGIQKINPNPTDADVMITLNLIEKDFCILSIYNSTGELKEIFEFSGETGTKNIKLNSKNYESGLYFVHFTSPTITDIQKLLIVK